MVDKSGPSPKRRRRSASSSSSSSSSSNTRSSSSGSSSSGSSSSSSSASPSPRRRESRPDTSRPVRRSRSPRRTGANAVPIASTRGVVSSSYRSPERSSRRRSPERRRSPVGRSGNRVASSYRRSRERSPRRGSPERRRSRERRSPPARKSSTERRRSPAARREVRKSRSKTPPPRKIQVRHLTRNVNKEHLSEIFGNYGKVEYVDLLCDHIHPYMSRGQAYIEFENPEQAEKAISYMNGAQIDGMEVSCEPVRHRGGRYR